MRTKGLFLLRVNERDVLAEGEMPRARRQGQDAEGETPRARRQGRGVGALNMRHKSNYLCRLLLRKKRVISVASKLCHYRNTENNDHNNINLQGSVKMPKLHPTSRGP